MAKTNAELAKKVNGTTTNGHAPATIADQVQHVLALPQMQAQIRAALPRHVTVERLTRIAVTTLRTTPQLLECSMESLLACIVQSAQLGLEPGILGHVYFVPFWNNKKGCKEAQFIIGYKGLITLARNSKEIAKLSSAPVYENDEFEYVKGFEETLRHVPKFANRGKLIGFYAYAVLTDDSRLSEFMTIEEINKIRGRSKAKDNGPWVTDFEEMGRKTVIRRLAKYLPLSVEIATAIFTDEKKEYGEAIPELHLEYEPQKKLDEGGTFPAVTEEAVADVEPTHKEEVQAQLEIEA